MKDFSLNAVVNAKLFSTTAPELIAFQIAHRLVF